MVMNEMASDRLRDELFRAGPQWGDRSPEDILSAIDAAGFAVVDKRKPISLDYYHQQLLGPLIQHAIEREGLLEPSLFPPPEPLPWWRRRWYGLTRRLGTVLLGWGRSLGGDEDA